MLFDLPDSVVIDDRAVHEGRRLAHDLIRARARDLPSSALQLELEEATVRLVADPAVLFVVLGRLSAVAWTLILGWTTEEGASPSSVLDVLDEVDPMAY